MKRIINKFKELSLVKRVQFIITVLLAAGLTVAMPVYAWFSGQKKAAEMYKVQYPNSLYVNAAHREDQMYFELDAVNVNEFEKDNNGKTIYYTDNTWTTPKTKEEDGENVYDTTGVTHIITSQKYVFSVYGTNTVQFKLQMAYTNNNQFKYNLYEAEEKTAAQLAEISPKPTNYVVRPANGAGAHTASRTVYSDDINLNDKDVDYYYVYKDTTPLSGSYLNTLSGSNDLVAQKFDDNGYYKNNYGDNADVDEKSIPIYWQSNNINADMDSNKLFCKHFVLEVTWDPSRTAEKKETDMIAISVKRQ